MWKGEEKGVERGHVRAAFTDQNTQFRGRQAAADTAAEAMLEKPRLLFA